MRPTRVLLPALLFLFAAAATAPASLKAAPEGTGLPLPRYVSLRADEANLRAGPGVQYPVEWVYHRQEMPVEVVAEYHTWRKVRDWQGSQGWVHQSILSSNRTVIVTGGLRTLRKKADSQSLPVARAEANAVGKLLSCPEDSTWCEVDLGGHKGWLRKVEFWGVYPGEVVR